MNAALRCSRRRARSIWALVGIISCVNVGERVSTIVSMTFLVLRLGRADRRRRPLLIPVWRRGDRRTEANVPTPGPAH